MKVLYINTVCGRSSTGRIVADMMRTLETHGHDSMCAYGRYSAPEDVSTVKLSSNLDFFSHVLLTRFFDKQGFGSKNVTKKLIELIIEFRPDILHLHNLHGSYLNIEILFDFLTNNNLPVVWTIHDCWPFTGHCTHYSGVNCYRWMTGCNECPRGREYPASFICDNSKNNYLIKRKLFTSINNMHIVTVSDWLKKQAEVSFLGRYPIKRIYNGIDLDVFKPVESDVRSRLGVGERYMILCVSDGWSERSGLRLILSLSEKLPDDYVVVLVGVQKNLLNKIPGRIITYERTDNVAQLVELYSAADVLLNPSHEQTFGLVVAEALACGTPAIVINSTACPEIVDNNCGIVVEKEDMENGLVDSVYKARSCGFSVEKCRKRAELFDKKDRYKDYIDLYLNMLSENGDGGIVS